MNGVELVRSDTADVPLGMAIAERLRIGGVDGPNAVHGVDEAGIAVAGGVLAILDRANHRVLTVDVRTGEVLARFGREGQGPFDLRHPLAISVVGDTVKVLEGTREAVLAFDTRGAPLAEVGVRLFHKGYSGAVRVGPHGLVLATDGPFRVEADSSTLALVEVTGPDTTALYEARTAGYRRFRIGMEGCASTLGWMDKPLGSVDLVWFAAPWGLAVNGTAAYEIEGLIGGRRRRIVRPFAVRKRTFDEAKSEVRQRVPVMRGEGGRSCPPVGEDFLAHAGYVEARQAVEDVALSPSGELWIRRHGDRDGAARIDIFDESGAYEGSLDGELPFPVQFASDGSFVAIETDDLGVQYIVVYAIQGGG